MCFYTAELQDQQSVSESERKVTHTIIIIEAQMCSVWIKISGESLSRTKIIIPVLYKPTDSQKWNGRYLKAWVNKTTWTHANKSE